MAAAYASNAPSHEVPDGNTTIIAPYSQLCASSVEATREGLATRVQYAFIVLKSREHMLCL